MLLGTLIDATGSSEAADHHRLAEAWRHWHARKTQLCCREVSLQKRVRRAYDTIGRTLLWGAGGWHLAPPIIDAVAKFERCIWRRMLHRSRQPEESWGDWAGRCARLQHHLLRQPTAPPCQIYWSHFAFLQESLLELRPQMLCT